MLVLYCLLYVWYTDTYVGIILSVVCVVYRHFMLVLCCLMCVWYTDTLCWYYTV